VGAKPLLIFLSQSSWLCYQIQNRGNLVIEAALGSFSKFMLWISGNNKHGFCFFDSVSNQQIKFRSKKALPLSPTALGYSGVRKSKTLYSGSVELLKIQRNPKWAIARIDFEKAIRFYSVGKKSKSINSNELSTTVFTKRTNNQALKKLIWIVAFDAVFWNLDCELYLAFKQECWKYLTIHIAEWEANRNSDFYLNSSLIG